MKHVFLCNDFKFFRGYIREEKTIVYYDAYEHVTTDGPFWSNQKPEEIRRQQRIEQQREQTNRMRNFGSNNRYYRTGPR